MKHKFLIIIIVSIAIFLVVFNLVMVNICIPEFMDKFNIKVNTASWILIIYMMFYSGFLLPSGKLGDIFGGKNAFILGIFLFGVASFLCSLTLGFFSFLFFRSLQGIGAAIIDSNAKLILKIANSKKDLGISMGIYGASAGMGAVLGLFLGGVSLRFFSWRSLFYINMPLTILAILLGSFALPISKDKLLNKKDEQSFDLLGMIVLLIIMSSFMLFIIFKEIGGKLSLRTVLIEFEISIFLIIFFIIEWKRKNALFDFHLFNNQLFLKTTTVMMLFNFLLCGITLMISVFLQKVMKYNSIEAAAVMLLLPLGMIVTAPLGGLMYDNFDRRLPAIFGAGILVLSLALFTAVILNYFNWLNMILIFFIGFGLGLADSPLTATAIESCPRDKTGIASGTFTMLKWLGGALGVGGTGVLLSKSGYGQGISNEIIIFRNIALYFTLLAGLGYFIISSLKMDVYYLYNEAKFFKET